jgi:hypothetical protein
MKSNTPNQLFYGFLFSNSPVLNPLAITATDSSSITLAQPTLLSYGNPTPTVVAFIGIDGVISLSGPTVSNSLTSVDVSAGGYTFNGLAGNQTYRIIVVAQNSSGYSVGQIIQSTGGIAPVMDALSLTATTDTSITLSVPTFSAAGNPLPPVQTRLAYIGPADGGSPITVDFLTGIVTNNIGAAVDVNSVAFPYTFSGLTPNTAYRIIVVAQNSSGLSIRQIAQNTGYSAPVMDPLSLTATTDTSISLSVPTFSTVGNPAPPVQTRLAYIGFASGGSAITVDYLTGIVTNNIGPAVDVNSVAFPYAFSGLTPNTSYRIIVVAQNSSGLSIRQIAQSTGYSAPVMDPLSLTATADTSITLSVPTFSTVGNPAPPVQTRLAYIGFASGGSAITVDYLTGIVTNNIGPAVDVNSVAFPYTFGGLTQDTSYTIVVVAQNSSGLSIRQISANTGCIAPILDNLILTPGVPLSAEIALTAPSFSNVPDPAPTVRGWIGEEGFISVSGTTVSGTSIIEANVDVSTGYTFGVLAPLTSGLDYRVIVISQSGCGYSVRQAVATAP